MNGQCTIYDCEYLRQTKVVTPAKSVIIVKHSNDDDAVILDFVTMYVAQIEKMEIIELGQTTPELCEELLVALLQKRQISGQICIGSKIKNHRATKPSNTKKQETVAKEDEPKESKKSEPAKKKEEPAKLTGGVFSKQQKNKVLMWTLCGKHIPTICEKLEREVTELQIQSWQKALKEEMQQGQICSYTINEHLVEMIRDVLIQYNYQAESDEFLCLLERIIHTFASRKQVLDEKKFSIEMKEYYNFPANVMKALHGRYSYYVSEYKKPDVGITYKDEID